MVIKGIIEEIVFRNDDNNYTVAVVDVNNESITCVGKFPFVCEGECVELNGNFIKHNRYGEQFSVMSVKITPPNSIEGIVKYLSSGLIKGVGPITAFNIVETFKQDTLDVIAYNPEKLTKVRGISDKKAREIAESYNEIKQMQNAVMLMQQYNISTNLAIKIFNFYQDKTEQVLKTNPYELVENIDGVGFFTADKIAQKMGINPHSEFRIRAGILHSLKENSTTLGNTYITQTNLRESVLNLLKIEIDVIDEKFDSILQKMVLDTVIKVIEKGEDNVVMLDKMYNTEKYVALSLQLMQECVSNEQFNITHDLDFYEQTNGIKMHERQRDAVTMAINNGISIITGGPGTGKTTIIKCVLELLKNQHKKVQLLAPTGRAAKRLSESTGQEALTIHRALEVDFTSMNLFKFNNLNKLPYDVVIVDEVSMVDVQLMYFLLRALKKGCRLILVGDKDQLSSVGAGNVLKDMLESNMFPSVCLSYIYRQSEDSLIVTNAHAINNGKMPVLNNKSRDFFMEEKSESQDVLDTILSLCTTRIPKFLNIDSSKIQVLAPMKNGVCGIDNLNKELQEQLNHPSINKLEVVTEKHIFRMGDRVMQIANNYEKEWIKDNFEEGVGVFNGDIGLISNIDLGSSEIEVTFEDGRIAKYLKSELSELTLSYAITIHKSQGSEFDVVIIPVISGPPMLLTRNLLYTAVTRAKKMVVLVGTKSCVARMVKNDYTVERLTMLKHFLSQNVLDM